MFAHLSQDKMTLSLRSQTEGVDPLELPSEEGLSLWLKRLRSAGYVHGLEMETIKKIQEHGMPEDSVIIGRGTLPVHERNVLQRHYDLVNEVSEENRPIDFRNLGFGKDVQAGDLLLEVIQEGPGKAGTNILGEKVSFEKEGEEHLPSIQGQIETTREGPRVEYRAGVDGFLWNNDPMLLKVTPELNWSGSVDHHIGNIQTQHHVEIGGDIASGFSVQAGKGVVIKGAVERKALCQSDGDIRVEGGIHKGATVSAGNNVFVRFSQGANIQCSGDMHVSDYLYDCEVQCEGCLTSEGKSRGNRGAIVGGVISSLKGMTLHSVGSPNSRTTLAVGVNLQLVKDMGELLREIKWNKAELSRLLRRLPISLADPNFQQKVATLPDKEKEAFKQLWENIVEHQERKKSMDGQFELMNAQKNDWPKDAAIRMEGPLVPDVKVLIGSSQLLIVDPIENQKIHQKDSSIFSEPL